MDLREVRDSSDLNRHPWEISRATSILSLLGESHQSKVADIGAGDMYFLRRFAERSGARLFACDIHFKESELGTDDGVEKVTRIEDIPPEDMDVVFLLDVLEHVEDEAEFLGEVAKVVKKDGKIIITVPAHPFLFGAHDVFLHHFRRYSAKGLRRTLRENGFEIEKLHFFYSSLFLARVVEKLFNSSGKSDKNGMEVNSWKFDVDHPLTRMIVLLLNCDFRINSYLHSYLNLSIPGLSLCAIVKKRV